MMKTSQAWGWLAAGVVAAGLNAAYHDGGLAWARRAADGVVERSQAVTALVRGQADRFLADVQVLTAENDAATNRANAVWTRVQRNVDEQVMDNALANAQAKIDRDLGRCQAGSARMEEMSARRQARLDEALARFNQRPAARTVRVNMTMAAFNSAQARRCTMQVKIPRIPMIKMPPVPPSPEIHSEAPSAGPV